MKKFLSRLIAVLSLFIICVILFFTVVDSLGMSDAYYKRFTTKGEHSLIVGTSRAAQGIVPSVINDRLHDVGFDLPIYDYGFDVEESPYGEIYFKSIKEKLGSNPKHNSLFIISVDPFSLSTERNMDSIHYREENWNLDRIHHFYKPQYKYLIINCRPHNWFHNNNIKLHDDGWLEVKGIPMDSVAVNERICRKMESYSSFFITPSSYRIKWLKEIIKLFNANGTVYLCRIPMSNQILQWEHDNWPSFEQDMENISDELSVKYFSFVNDNSKYRTTDGNHLYKDDAALFTQALCDSIISSLTNY